MSGSRLFNFAFSIIAFWLLLITLWHCVVFLWIGAGRPDAVHPPPNAGGESQQSSRLGRILLGIVINVVLLALFILQHSGLTSIKLKSYINDTKWEVLYRSVYIFTTAIALQGIIRYWQWIPEVSLWRTNVEPSTVKWWIFFAAHVLAWILLYGGCIMMDFAEMVGLKQVYYHSCDLDTPLHLKSPELQTFYQHMRHPSFGCLGVILWFHPFMTLGRLMLALTFTLYMVLRFRVDMSDYYYQKHQFDIKLRNFTEWGKSSHLKYA